MKILRTWRQGDTCQQGVPIIGFPPEGCGCASASVCCQSAAPVYLEPEFEVRFKWMTREKCAYRLAGGDFVTQERDFFCLLDESYEGLWTQTQTIGGEYYDPSQRFQGPWCDGNTEYDPNPLSWPFPCNTLFVGFRQELGEGRGKGAIVSDESLRNDVLSLLEQSSFFDWYSAPIGLQNPAQGTYKQTGIVGYGEKAEYRISHFPTPTCYLKVWIAQQAYIYVNDELSLLENNDYLTYVWEPEERPCLPYPDLPIFAEEQKIKSDTNIIEAGALDVIYFAFMAKYSFIKDYEPDDPVIIDPFNVLRPDPDLNPNGLPLDHPDFVYL